MLGVQQRGYPFNVGASEYPVRQPSGVFVGLASSSGMERVVYKTTQTRVVYATLRSIASALGLRSRSGGDLRLASSWCSSHDKRGSSSHDG